MFKFKKKLSQVFLVDENIKKKIIKSINIQYNDIILEFGAGDGSISKYLSYLPNQIFFIELDTTLIPKLKKKIQHDNKKKIYNDDILKFNLKDIIKKYKKIRIMGNIPYKISTKLILNLIKFKKNIIDIHFVIQKEICEKLIFTQNKKQNYTSIITQYNYNIEKLFNIKANSFKPIPKIQSSFVKLTPIYKNKKPLNYNIFTNIIKTAFNKRRKYLFKSIKHINKFKKFINVTQRAENININNYIRISNLLASTKHD